MLRSTLARKFPGLETMPDIDRVMSVETLEALLVEHAAAGIERAAVERAIRSAGASAE